MRLRMHLLPCNALFNVNTFVKYVSQGASDSQPGYRGTLWCYELVPWVPSIVTLILSLYLFKQPGVQPNIFIAKTGAANQKRLRITAKIHTLQENQLSKMFFDFFIDSFGVFPEEAPIFRGANEPG